MSNILRPNHKEKKIVKFLRWSKEGTGGTKDYSLNVGKFNKQGRSIT